MYGEIRPALEGPSKRTLPLRMLFVHSDNAAVGRCLRQFEAARFRVSADVVAAPSHFVKRLDSKSYDLVIVEFPTPNWRGLGAQEILAPCARRAREISGKEHRRKPSAREFRLATTIARLWCLANLNLGRLSSCTTNESGLQQGDL